MINRTINATKNVVAGAAAMGLVAGALGEGMIMNLELSEQTVNESQLLRNLPAVLNTYEFLPHGPETSSSLVHTVRPIMTMVTTPW